MPETYHSGADVTISLDNGPGGTPVDISLLTMELGGLKIEVNTVPVTAFSDAWERHKRAGTKKIPDIPIKGQMTSEMHALMVASLSSDPNAEEQTLTIGFGGDFQFDVECVVADYEAGPKAGTLNEFTATLRPSGEGIWST
jgi:hypothetical protein